MFHLDVITASVSERKVQNNLVILDGAMYRSVLSVFPFVDVRRCIPTRTHKQNCLINDKYMEIIKRRRRNSSGLR